MHIHISLHSTIITEFQIYIHYTLYKFTCSSARRCPRNKNKPNVKKNKFWRKYLNFSNFLLPLGYPIPLGFLKKCQPIRSSRLASYSWHIYISEEELYYIDIYLCISSKCAFSLDPPRDIIKVDTGYALWALFFNKIFGFQEFPRKKFAYLFLCKLMPGTEGTGITGFFKPFVGERLGFFSCNALIFCQR